MVVVGLMSGTSLDGLDLCAVRFTENASTFKWELLASTTLPYTNGLLYQLSNAFYLKAEDLIALHSTYGYFLGEKVKEFLNEHNISADIISSHGHTIFHNPTEAYTFQLGHGACIAAECGLPVVSDFRMSDVAYMGQGAPLVPKGDQQLFSDYNVCLNLGGFANISIRDENQVLTSFDVAPCNIVLNEWSKLLGVEYDEGGKLAADGSFLPSLCSNLDALPFYGISGPKSLGREWYQTEFKPLLRSEGGSPQDILHTCILHLTYQLKKVTRGLTGKMLVTGGGAHNTFLMDSIKKHLDLEVVVPEKQIVDFKEALIFAYLGWLRWNGKSNALASVTGAVKDVCCGAIHLPS